MRRPGCLILSDRFHVTTTRGMDRICGRIDVPLFPLAFLISSWSRAFDRLKFGAKSVVEHVPFPNAIILFLFNKAILFSDA